MFFYCDMCDISGNFVNGSRIGAVHLDNIAINFCNLTDICVVSEKGVRVLSFRAKESELVSNYRKKIRNNFAYFGERFHCIDK